VFALRYRKHPIFQAGFRAIIYPEADIQNMSEFDPRVVLTVPPAGLVRLTHIIYLLQGFSVLMGILGPALTITTFLTGWPSIIAVILNYLKRKEVRHTYLDSHFGWQIRTFWYALPWLVIASMPFVTVIGITSAYVLAVGTGIWVIYRVRRGWMALNEGKFIPL
jgi:uncharacterized membrane protein